MKHLLLTGARAPATLELARLLHAGGHTVSVADPWRLHACRFSRTVHASRTLPAPRRNFPAFRDRLAALVRSSRIDVIVPTCEEVFWVARCGPALGPDVEVFAPTFDVLRTLHHKGLFARYVAGLGLRAPRTVVLESAQDALALAPQASALVFKPAYSRFGTRVLVAPQARELERVRPSPSAPWVAQDRLEGTEWCAYAVARGGRLAALATYAPRFRSGRVAVHYEAHVQPSVEQWVEDFVSRSGLSGQLAFDFIVDARGDAWPLECNPRLTGGVHLFHGRADFAGAFVEPPPATLRPSLRGGRQLGAAMLLGGHLRSRAGRAAFARSTDVLFDRRDPLPFAAQPLLLGALTLRALRARRGLHDASVQDIEWNGEQ